MLFAVLLAIDAIFLGWSIAYDEAIGIGASVVHIGFSLYTLGLAFRSVSQSSASLHSESVLHLTALTSLASILLFSIAILPDTPPIIASVETIPFLWYLWHARLCLYIIICIVTMTTRRGPALRYPSDRIYTEKTILAGTNNAEENVSGSVGMWHKLLFRL